MKYLKLYESVEKKDFDNFLGSLYAEDNWELWTSGNIRCIGGFFNYKTDKKEKLTSLHGIEKITSCVKLDCGNNELTSLKGIENLINIKKLDCSNNQLNHIEEMKKLINLEFLDCYNNELTSLKGIDNSKKLKKISCYRNKLTNLEFGDFSMDALELGIDVTDMNRFKELHTIYTEFNSFPKRYENYIKKFFKEKNIVCRI